MLQPQTVDVSWSIILYSIFTVDIFIGNISFEQIHSKSKVAIDFILPFFSFFFIIIILTFDLFETSSKRRKFSSSLNFHQNRNEPRHNKTCLQEFPTRSDSNWSAQLRKLVWGFKFWLHKLEILHYLGSENKGADQTARIRRLICAFVVRIWHKTHFLMARLKWMNIVSIKVSFSFLFEKWSLFSHRVSSFCSWVYFLLTTLLGIVDLLHMSRNMTKPTKWVCAQRRLRSAWASAKSDQSVRCPHEEILGP